MIVLRSFASLASAIIIYRVVRSGSSEGSYSRRATGVVERRTRSVSVSSPTCEHSVTRAARKCHGSVIRQSTCDSEGARCG